MEVVICQVADTLEIGPDWQVDTFWVILVSPLLDPITYLFTTPGNTYLGRENKKATFCTLY